jgi:hypothetical protein
LASDLSLTTLSIFYQASLLAAILQKLTQLNPPLKKITITDSGPDSQQVTTPVSVKLHNGLAYTQLKITATERKAKRRSSYKCKTKS